MHRNLQQPCGSGKLAAMARFRRLIVESAG
jgi:hypothetical protein